ncbi:hypothetical protein [Shimwellia pseudoproteus]|uniref:hypothetical protein n=1 Tax=Shimwellia pseudoproteus TaxID=570012 RepID=UPI0018ED0046|nr:hypothetical protein [Shimwellia pseudoproteus]
MAFRLKGHSAPEGKMFTRHEAPQAPTFRQRLAEFKRLMLGVAVVLLVMRIIDSLA